MARFTLPRDLYHGKGALEALKTFKGKKAMICVGGGSMKRFGLFGRYVLLLAKATHPIFRSPRNENIHRAGMIPQDIVGTTAHENTRLPRGDVADHVALYLEQRLAAQHVGHPALVAPERHAQVTDQRGKEAPRLLLVGLLEKFRAEAALLGRQIDQLLVIDVHAQTTPQRSPTALPPLPS